MFNGVINNPTVIRIYYQPLVRGRIVLLKTFHPNPINLSCNDINLSLPRRKVSPLTLHMYSLQATSTVRNLKIGMEIKIE